MTPPNRESRLRGQAELGVRRCSQLMADGAWETGASHTLVAAEYGVSERTVEGWAIQASRIIRALVGDGEELRGRLAILLERHERVAMGKKTLSVRGKGDATEIVEVPDPDVKAATGAVKALAEVMGLVTKKHEHAHVVTNYESLPRSEKIRWLHERAAQLVSEANRLEGVIDVPALPSP